MQTNYDGIIFFSLCMFIKGTNERLAFGNPSVFFSASLISSLFFFFFFWGGFGYLSLICSGCSVSFIFVLVAQYGAFPGERQHYNSSKAGLKKKRGGGKSRLLGGGGLCISKTIYRGNLFTQSAWKHQISFLTEMCLKGQVFHVHGNPAYSTTNIAAIMQSSLPSTSHPGNCSHALVKSSSEPVITCQRRDGANFCAQGTQSSLPCLPSSLQSEHLQKIMVTGVERRMEWIGMDLKGSEEGRKVRNPKLPHPEQQQKTQFP